MHRCPWSRDEIDVLVFFYVPDAVTLTSFFFFAKNYDCFLNTASVGGRRRKSAEEQCAEVQARTRQTIIRACRGKVEGHHAENLDRVNAFLVWPPKRDGQRRTVTTAREPRRAVVVRRSPRSSRMTLTTR